MNYSGNERFFDRDELIVSKTDLKGRITYANDVFLRLADLTEEEVLGAPHSIIRHENMPRAVFHLLWQTIAAGSEIFAYVVNKSKNGDYYWVLAHVTPSYSNGKIVGYHSTRRSPNPDIIHDSIEPLYDQLLAVEASHKNRKEGMQESFAAVVSLLNDKGVSYDEFASTLMRNE